MGRSPDRLSRHRESLRMTIHMTDAEYAAAREFDLMPLEARAFVALRDCADNYCPKERIHSDDSTRKVLICNLRKKLGIRIINIRGRGYLLEKRLEAAE